MHGRPMLGKHRMITVATRIEPQEIDQLKELAADCDMSVCAYLRDLIRLEIARATRGADRAPAGELPIIAKHRNGAAQAGRKIGAEAALDLPV